MKSSSILLQNGAEKALNRLAREQMKLKLLADIRTDLIICELEGYNKKEYLLELKDIIDSFID